MRCRSVAVLGLSLSLLACARATPETPRSAAAAPAKAAPAPAAPAPTTAAAHAPAPAEPPPAPAVIFARDVRPILEARCQPCHFAGGKMYEKLPFDRAETVSLLGTKLFTRIKDEKEQHVITAFLAQDR